MILNCKLIKSQDRVSAKPTGVQTLKSLALFLGLPIVLFALYVFFPEGKKMNTYGEMSSAELSQAADLIKKSKNDFGTKVKVINTLYHKLHGQPIPDGVHIKQAEFGRFIKMIFPGYGDISFYPNNTIYIVDRLSHVGYMAHETGHMTYQSFSDFLHDNMIGSDQYNIFSLDAAGVDEAPSIFAQFEFAAIAANYDPQLSKEIYESIDGLPGISRDMDMYVVPAKTIYRLIYQYGDAKQVKAKIFEMDYLKNYKKYAVGEHQELPVEEYLSKNFQFFSEYLREGNSIAVMEPLVRANLKNSNMRKKWLMRIWNGLSEEAQKNTLRGAISLQRFEQRTYRIGNNGEKVYYPASAEALRLMNSRELPLEIEFQNQWKQLSEKEKLRLVENYHSQALNASIDKIIQENIKKIDAQNGVR